MEEWSRVGCWNMIRYNTDKFLSSALWHNSEDGRCTLSFSGYHGSLAGYTRGVAALVWPPAAWNVCGQEMFAPYVRLMRHHMALSNWSAIVRKMAGPEAVCKGELTFAAESMGGSAGEQLAACANAGRQSELMDAALPHFTISSFYTYGAPAASVKPIVNPLREDGCFKGKRIFFATDPIAHIGALFNLQHPRMDAVEIWTPKTRGVNPSLRALSCKGDLVLGDEEHVKPPQENASISFASHVDKLSHEVTTYKAVTEWLEKIGEDGVFQNEPYSAKPPPSNAAMYMAMLQEDALPEH